MNISIIFKLQKKAIHIIFYANHNAHFNSLFYQQGILLLEKIITYSKLMFMHAVVYNYTIEFFVNVWQNNNQRNIEMDLRNANDLVLPPVNSETFRRFPLYSLPHEWNQLGDTKLQQNRTTFKYSLLYDFLNN
jgi:hypothetical protein